MRFTPAICLTSFPAGSIYFRSIELTRRGKKMCQLPPSQPWRRSNSTDQNLGTQRKRETPFLSARLFQTKKIAGFFFFGFLLVADGEKKSGSVGGPQAAKKDTAATGRTSLNCVIFLLLPPSTGCNNWRKGRSFRHLVCCQGESFGRKQLLVIHSFTCFFFSKVEKMTTTSREIRQRFTRLAAAGQHVVVWCFHFCLPPTNCCGPPKKSNGPKWKLSFESFKRKWIVRPERSVQSSRSRDFRSTWLAGWCVGSFGRRRRVTNKAAVVVQSATIWAGTWMYGTSY